jgi:hypothetical protein
MAIIQTNPLVSGLRGMVGGTIVFKTLRGKTIMANRPRKPSRESKAQRTNRNKFKDATYFAKSMMKNPEKKAYYWRQAKKLGLPNAYTAAIRAYMRGGEEGVRSQKPGVTLHRHRLREATATTEGYGGQGRRDGSKVQVRRTGRGPVNGARAGTRVIRKQTDTLNREYLNTVLRPLRFAWGTLRNCLTEACKVICGQRQAIVSEGQARIHSKAFCGHMFLTDLYFKLFGTYFHMISR